MAKRTKKMRSRQKYNIRAIQITVALVFVFAIILVGALFKIQVLDHAKTSILASDQYYSTQMDPARRGSIYDRNGIKLASTSFVYRVGITPKHVYSRSKAASPSQIEEKFADILDIPLADVQSAMGKVESSYEQLAKNVPEEQGKQLEAYLQENAVGGVRLDKEPKRYYLNGNLASQVLGFASYDEGEIHGRLGMELAYDSILSGSAGFDYAARDNYLSHGYLPYGVRRDKAKADGLEIVSTLDLNIQDILQEDLESAIKAYDAVENGMGIVMNPYNGEILAMASYPYFESSDPTGPPSGVSAKDWDQANETTIQWLQENAWKNKNISSLYEAGSTMKTLTAAMGMEENVTSEDKVYNDDTIQVLDAEISCYGGGHGYETMEMGFWNSCNPIFVQVALELGVDTFYQYIRDFGFYEPTGLGMPGETNCIFHTNPSILDMSNLSFGESSGVTTMHLMKAFGALVNGGKLITPTLVKEIRTQDGQIVESHTPEVTRRVISPSTSARVRKLMQGMVEHSQGYTNAWGYNIGGKTSTSTDELEGQITISFMAAAPIEHPEVLVMIVLQKPSNPELGGTEAQIVTMNTCSRILDYLNVDRAYSDTDIYKFGKSIATPNLIGYKVTDAAQSLTFQQISVKAMGENTQGDSKIKSQFPAEGTLIYPGSNIFVFSKVPDTTFITMPDFSQMNYNEIINTCNRLGLTPNFQGPLDGNCVSQRLISGELAEGSSGLVGESVSFGSVVEVTMALDTAG